MQTEVMLSVIMPVYNHPSELKVMLESILANTYKDWELLAIDDGSNEETKAVLRHYADMEARICVIERNREPKGAQTCRNMGLELAQGEYVVFFDSDDFVQPFCFEQRVRELSAHPELDFMVFRNGVQIDNDFHAVYPRSSYGYPIYKDDVRAFCQRTLPFVVWNNIYRRQSLIEHGILWDTNLLSLQDAQFNLECLLSGMEYTYSSCPADYGYRINVSGSVSGSIHTEAHHKSNLYATERFYRAIRQRYGHRHDLALLRGRLFVYTKEARNAENTGSRLHRRIARLRRQLTMLPYLIWYRYMERRWIPRQIKKQFTKE